MSKPTASNGKLITIDSFPSTHVDPHTVRIWLPNGYDASKSYAVLYMHDGQMLFDSTITWTQQEWKVDETMTRLINEKKIRPAIVVGIDNNGSTRWSEYVPQALLKNVSEQQRELIIDKWLAGKPQSDHYLQFIVEELKPYIDKTYATASDKANTFIIGSSMGAIISLYAICSYPDVFGGAGCLSTHWPLDVPAMNTPDITMDGPAIFSAYLESYLPSPADHKIYFDYGTETLDSLYEPLQLRVDAIMLKKGYDSKNWMTKKFPGDAHMERDWARRLHIPVEFLLGT